MKKLLSVSLLLFSLVLISHSNSQAQHKTKLGVGVLYGSEVESAGIQANAVFRVSPRVAIAPDVSIFFPDEDTPGFVDNWWAANLNGQLMLATDPDFHIYGLGGLNVTTIDFEGADDESESELGLNLGLGGEYHLEGFSLFSELKYVVGDLDQVVLGAGARFHLN